MSRLHNMWYWVLTPYRKIRDLKFIINDYGSMSSKYAKGRKKIEELELELWKKNTFLREANKTIRKLREVKK